MPLLGKRIYRCAKPILDVKEGDTIYTIQHSKEQFRSKDEYEKRAHLYKERIWTCQCTGHTMLTHEEAFNSEKVIYKTLKESYAECYAKFVLELVHHSISSLDTLVDQSWLKIQQCLSIGENVVLKVKNAGKLISGKVTKLDKCGITDNPTSNCSSPSSDKENDGDEKDKTPKKWVAPKLLGYKYTLKLDDSKIINEVPAADIVRVDKPPSKETVRLFVRANAVRAGVLATSPWVVDEKLVKKYNIPNKLNGFLISPTKMAEDVKKVEDEIMSKKRKSSSKPSGSSSKKLKTEKSKSKDNKKQLKLTGSPFKKNISKLKSPKKTPEFVEIDDSDSDMSLSLAAMKKTDSEDSDLPISKLKDMTPKKSKSNNSTPVKKKSPLKPQNGKTKSKTMMSLEISDSDEPLSDIKPLKSGSPKKSKSKSNSSTPVKKKSPSKKDKEKSKPKSGLKQVTLYQLTKKGAALIAADRSSPKKTMGPPDSKKSPGRPKIPDFIPKLEKALVANDKARIEFYLIHAVKTLTPSQRAKLPDSIKDKVAAKYKLVEEKKMLAKMTPEERMAYIKKKRTDERKKKQLAIKQRTEDQELDLKPLPQPKLVETADGLPNEAFGDVAMVTEFISCFADLLMPDEEYPIYYDALMKCLSSGKAGHTYLSRVLMVLLQTLLQDDIAKDYSELKIKLTDIPVNQYTSSELVRLCLRRDDVEENESDLGDEDALDAPEDTIQLLESQEMYELDAMQKLSILKGLCSRIMGSYSVQDFMEQKQRDAAKLWREKAVQLKEKKDKKKLTEQKNKDKNEKEKSEDKEVKEEKKDDKPNVDILHFYGKKEESGTPSPAPNEADEESKDDEDIISRVKNRRVLAAKAAEEKAKREEEKQIELEKQLNVYKEQKEAENFEKKFNDGIRQAKMVLRQTPIGTDRNHSRYWIFKKTTPGLFIEKGWVTRHIDYCTRSDEAGDPTEDILSESDTESVAESEINVVRKPKEMEKTAPHIGQNLWFCYDSLKDLDCLLENLHGNGIRESYLKQELSKKYSLITKAITNKQRTNNELRDSDGDTAMLKGFKDELMETELRLRNGGLGGVTDFNLWDKTLETATSLTDMGKCLLQTQQHVLEKFLGGIMRYKKNVPAVNKEDDKDAVEEDVSEDENEEENTPKGVLQWRESVENSQTLSRFFVLLGLLDSCVKWEKSSENARCKICRKKCNEDRLLLCDECNQAFHCYCLRPAITKIPSGEWFCPSCIPESEKRTRRPQYTFDEDSDDVESEEIENEDKCFKCDGDDNLIFCGKCPSAYHTDCLKPALKYPPRGYWECPYCKAGKKRPSRRRKTPAKPVSKHVKKILSSDEDEEMKSRKARPSNKSRTAAKKKQYVESEDSSSEEEDVKPKRPKKNAVKKKQYVESEDPSSEEEDVKPKRPKKNVRKRNESDDSDSDAPPKKSARRSQTQTSRSRGNKPAEVVPDVDTGYKAARRCPSELSVCEEMMTRLIKHEDSWPFLHPVDKKLVPDYHKIVKKPMTFTMVKQKLTRLSYSSPQDVVGDVALVFNNAELYNQSDSEVSECIPPCEKFFLELLKKVLPDYVSSYRLARDNTETIDECTNSKRRSRNTTK